MPGPIVHLIVQQRLSQHLRELKEGSGSRYADILDKGAKRCSPYAAFGSMGPDYLFFSLKEYGTPLDELLNFIFKAYDALEPLIEFYEDNIEPVVDQIEGAVDTADEALLLGLIGDIRDTASMASTTAVTAAAALATQNIDMFNFFYPQIQKGASESKWYWADFLHIRRTGDFVSNMWRLAGNDQDLQCYVLGYASHVGTDVTGHPFVNAVTGGPFRMHWHRHHLVENWIDAYSRTKYPDSATTLNCLHLGGDDQYRPNAISGSYYFRLTQFSGSKMPKKLSKLIARAMEETYGNADHPEFMGEADLDSTYRLWQAWFKRSTSIGDMQAPTPVPPPGSVVAGLVNDYASGVPPFPRSGRPSGGGFSVAGLFAAMAGFIKWLGDVLIYTGEWIYDHAGDIFLLPRDEAIGTLKWFLYQIQKGIWEIYDNLRFMLVLGGYLNPEPRDLHKDPWGKAFINTNFAHLTDGGIAKPQTYPLRQEAHSLLGTTEHHLIYPRYPNPNKENPHTESVSHLFYGAWPETFISTRHNYDPYIDKLYDCEKPYGNDERATNYINMRTFRTAQLGSSLFFGARLIAERLEKMPNFNLDGDRGYGWKTWRASSPRDIEDNRPNNPITVNVDYIDS